MNLTLKQHKLLKTKLVLENNSLILFSNKVNSDSKKYEFYSVRNKLLKKLLNCSFLCNLNYTISGKVVLITLKKNVSMFEKNKFTGLMLNRKLYSIKQLNKLKDLNYSKNIRNLHNLLNFNLLLNSNKLKKISK